MATVKNQSQKNLEKNRKKEDFREYPSILLDNIKIVDRPILGSEHEQIFFNPRFENRITEESLMGMSMSIRTDGLLQPPICRGVKGQDFVELLAGERRVRSLRYLVKHNLPCFHQRLERPTSWQPGTVVMVRGAFASVVEQKGDLVVVKFFDESSTDDNTVPFSWVFPTTPAADLYSSISVKLLYGISDEEALRVAMTENERDEPLTVAEEIAVVERLIRRGLSQKEIVYCLGENVTWVSQTSSFRSELPTEAFQMLMDGRMARHVAVRFFSYPKEDRVALMEESQKVEERDTAEKVRKNQLQMERHEDDEELHLDAANEAQEAGDAKAAEKEKKKAVGAAKKAKEFKTKRDRAKKESGTIKQSHLDKAAVKAGIVPRKAKMLSKLDVEKLYIDDVDGLIVSKAMDPLCNQRLPVDFLSIMQATARAILVGNRDPLSVIREYMVQSGKWELPTDDDDIDDVDADEEEDEEEEDDEEYDDDGTDDDDDADDDDYEDDDYEDDDYDDIQSVIRDHIDEELLI